MNLTPQDQQVVYQLEAQFFIIYHGIIARVTDVKRTFFFGTHFYLDFGTSIYSNGWYPAEHCIH